MVDTIKFSQMTDGGDIANDDKVPGLLSGANVLFNNPWTFLPPGTTAERPTPSSTINYRLRFNTDEQLYEYYDATLGAWTQLQESAFTVGPFITYTADTSLPDAQNLGLLANGILKQTISTGSATLNIAVNDTDYYGPGMTGYFQAPAGVKDSNGNIVLGFVSTASSVNYLNITNYSTGGYPRLSAAGSDANIQLGLVAKGNRYPLLIGGTTSSIGCGWAIDGTAQAILNNIGGLTGTRTVTWQDSDGVVAFLGDIPAPPSGPYVIYTADLGIPGAQNIGALSSGILKQTVSGGVSTLAIALNDTDYYGPGMTGYIQAPAGIKDSNGNIILSFSSTASAVNYLEIANNFTGGAPNLHVNGANADIILGLRSKGQGAVALESLSPSPVQIYSGAGFQHETIFTMADTAATRTVTWQDADGTVAYLSDIPAGTPSALTATPDTNVTITLGGTPATALLEATSITLGWTGQLSFARGGTNASLTASNGGIVYSTASAMAILAGTVTANLPLLSGSTTAPSWGSFPLLLGGALTTAGALTTIGAFSSTFTFTNTTSVTFPTSGTLATTSQLLTSPLTTKGDLWAWSTTNARLPVGSSDGQILQVSSAAATGLAYSTATYPATTTINQILYSSAANTITGLATANNAILVTNGSGVPSLSTTLPSGIAIKSVNLQQFAAGTTTYTPSSNMVSIIVEIIGGGGGAGGSLGGSAGNFSTSGGGTGGGYCRKIYTSAQLGANAAVIVGAFGQGGNAGNNAGNDGGDSTFTPAGAGAALFAPGGTHGSGAASSTTLTTSGSAIANTPTGGDLNIAGQDGGAGAITSITTGIFLLASGGGSALGQGAPMIVKAFGSSYQGHDGVGYGAGGGGAGSSTVSKSGGSGTDGICLVWEFIA